MKQDIFDKINFDKFFHNSESFINKEMLRIVEGIETQRENEVVKAIHRVAVDVDEEKVKQWIERAKLLDEIDNSTLISIATRKRFLRLIEENEKLKEENNRQHNEIVDLNEQIEILEERMGERL